MIAAIRVRGTVGTEHSVENTMRSMHLYRKNYCTLVNESSEMKGMLTKAKDFITWGIVDSEIEALLRKKSGKKYYRLNSPRKGFGRKGIKHHFSAGGALGDRKEKINDLIRRML
jgi:large subunit ribosomal protein L30